MNDDAGVSAEFEHDFFLAGSALDVPANGGAAGEADHLRRSSVTSSPASSFESGKTFRAPSGQPACCTGSARSSAAQRGLRRGLEHHGASMAIAGATLCATRFSGKLNGRDPGDRSEWEATDDAPAPGSELLPVQRQVFAVDASAFFRRHIEGEDRAFNLGTGRLDWLARFLRDGVGKLFLAMRDMLRRPAEARAAARKPAAGGLCRMP